VLAHPSRLIQYARMGMLSPTGACRAFGAGADGIVLGEGVGAVVLTSLRRAESVGDHVHGVLLATATNSGGHTSGFTVPSPRAQAALVSAALDRAGLPATALDYLEAHGTGTPLGDPIEIRGLQTVFDRFPPGRCAVGSVKTNIGHLEPAAGIAGLTKVLLQLRHGEIAPSLYAKETNEHIDFGGSLYVPTEPTPWPRRAPATPRRAGVSAFGAGGVNAHAVVAEHLPTPVPATPARDELVLLSARTPDAVVAAAHRLAAHLAFGEPPLADVAYTLRVGREAMPYRLAFVARTVADLRAALTDDALPGLVRRAGAAAPPSGADLVELGRAWCAGAEPDWDTLLPAGRRVPLPTYPFDRARYWLRTASETRTTDDTSLAGRLRVIAAEVAGVDPDRFDTGADFADYGFNSVLLASMASRINRECGVELTVVSLFDHHTIDKLADHVLATSDRGASWITT
jgi:acyl transferase domain-containing protein